MQCSECQKEATTSDGWEVTGTQPAEAKKAEPMTSYIPAAKPDLIVDWLKPKHRSQTIERPASKPVIGRNDPCPCKSGKKFKLCCLKRTS
jgi:uncharacterized protein YecA (UPF0149 family)